MSRIRKAALTGVAVIASMALAFGGAMAANATTSTDVDTTTVATTDSTPTGATEQSTNKEPATQAAPPKSEDVSTNKPTEETKPEASTTDKASTPPAPATTSDESTKAPSEQTTDPTASAPSQGTEQTTSNAAPGDKPATQVGPNTAQTSTTKQATGLVRTKAWNLQVVTGSNGETTISFDYSLADGFDSGYVFASLYKGEGTNGDLVGSESVPVNTSGTKTYTKTLTLSVGSTYTVHVTGNVDCNGDCFGELPILDDYTFTVKEPCQCETTTTIDINTLIKRGEGKDYNSVVIQAADCVQFIDKATGKELQPGTVVIPEEGLTIVGKATCDCVEVTGKVHVDYVPLSKVEKSQTSKTDCDTKQVTATYFETTYTRTSSEGEWVKGETKQVGTDTRAATDEELKAAQCAVVVPPVVTPPDTPVQPAAVVKPAPVAAKTLAVTGTNGDALLMTSTLAASLLACGALVMALRRRSQRREVGVNNEG